MHIADSPTPIDDGVLDSLRSSLDAIQQVIDKAEAPRTQLRGSRTPKPSARKRRRLEVRASRRANR